MAYFVTGASGFIGKRLVKKLLERADAVVYFLMREDKGQAKKVKALRTYWGANDKRAIAMTGDLKEPTLGLARADQKLLKGNIDHFFHLAAIYDLSADA